MPSPQNGQTHSNKFLGLALKELNVLISPITSDNIHQRMNFQYDNIHEKMNFQCEQLLSNIANYIKLMINFLLILVLYILRNHQRTRRFPEIIMQSECIMTWRIQGKHWREVGYTVLLIDLCIWSIMCKLVSSWKVLTWVSRVLSCIIYLICNTFLLSKRGY